MPSAPAPHPQALPSLLEFLSYVFAFGNLLAGPFFELRDYLDYIGRMVRSPCHCLWRKPVSIHVCELGIVGPVGHILIGCPNAKRRAPAGWLAACLSARLVFLQGDWDARDPKKRIPSPLLPGLARLGKGLALLAVWSQLVGSYSPDLMESEWWGTVPVWKRWAGAGSQGLLSLGTHSSMQGCAHRAVHPVLSYPL